MALHINPTNIRLLSSSLAHSTRSSTPRTLVLRSPGSSRGGQRGRNFFHICRSSLVDELEGTSAFTAPEAQLIEALIGIQGRGRSASPEQLKEVERAVQTLEGLGGIPDPTGSELIEGRWQLMFTTRPGTASPIQRTFVGVDFFSVFQEIYLRTNDPRVSNVVVFSDALGELKVEAVASMKDGKRILFRFDRAAFSFKFLPFKVPYPVPFRLLGDEAKGWLDTTYLSASGNLRVSRGNKGTTFVLQKISDPRQRLLSDISKGKDVKEQVDKFLSINQNQDSGEIELVEGEWKMIWSSQYGKYTFEGHIYTTDYEVRRLDRKYFCEMETESWIENAANGLMGSQIIRKNGQIKFVVDIIPGFRFSMIGKFVRSDTNSYELTMDDAAIIGGPFGYPVQMETKLTLKLLYSDDKIRITRGYRDIVFVHLRLDRSKK